MESETFIRPSSEYFSQIAMADFENGDAYLPDSMKYAEGGLGDAYHGSINLYFNWLGVLTRFEVTKYDRELKKEVVVDDQWIEWPADQIKEYNKKALKDILLFMPSRFKEGTSLFTRMRYFVRQYTINWVRG